MTNKRIDLHMHTLFSDGELLPSELARRAEVLGHSTIAFTDHVDYSNIETITEISKAIEDINNNWNINVILGAEITHAPTQSIPALAKKARELGAKIVVVHGETLSEPVIEGTNLAAVSCEDVDILAHPGLITKEEAEIAKENDVALEISARKGHSLVNVNIHDIDTSNCVIRIMGKGSKERIVPLGDYAIKYIEINISEKRIKNYKKD